MYDYALEFSQENEDFIDVYLGDHHLGTLDYDTYGRSGQYGAKEMLTRLADAFSLDVIET